MERLSTILLAPVSIKRISLVLAFLVAAPVATKLINGYLLCDFTLTMYYEDLAIGIAMLISCGIILLLASAINRDPKTTKGRCLRYVALVLIVALLWAYAGCAAWSHLLNRMAGTANGICARITNQTEFDDAQLDLWQPLEQFIARRKHQCDQFADMENAQAQCMDFLEVAWSMMHSIHRNDPLNLCASNNNNETIKAIFASDKATFQLTHRVDAVFKFAASVEWFAASFVAIAVFVAMLVFGSIETDNVGLVEIFTFGNSAAGHSTKNIP